MCFRCACWINGVVTWSRLDSCFHKPDRKILGSDSWRWIVSGMLIIIVLIMITIIIWNSGDMRDSLVVLHHIFASQFRMVSHAKSGVQPTTCALSTLNTLHLRCAKTFDESESSLDKEVHACVLFKKPIRHVSCHLHTCHHIIPTNITVNTPHMCETLLPYADVHSPVQHDLV